MSSKNQVLPPVFDTDLWLLHYDDTQHTLLVALNNLGNGYKQLEQQHAQAPRHLKQSVHARLMRLQQLIEDLYESYNQGRDYISSMVASLYVEYELMKQAKDHEIDDLHQHYTFLTDALIRQCEQRIQLPPNNN